MATAYKATAFYDAGEQVYNFPFLYLRKEFVKARYDHEDGEITPLEYNRDYSVHGQTLTLTEAGLSVLVEGTARLCIYRETPTDQLVRYADASVLKAYDMNLAEIQLLHLAEENTDYIVLHSLSIDLTDNAWQGFGHRIKNVGDPVAPQDAVTLRYLNEVDEARIHTMRQIQEATAALLAQTQASEANAGTFAANAGASEAKAKTSETNAKDSETKAKVWAEGTDAEVAPLGGEHSSKGWASRSASSATNAALSYANAAASEQAAAGSASAAAVSAANAVQSATAASGSASSAAGSASSAQTASALAGTKATEAAASAAAASESEQNAAASAQAAQAASAAAAQAAADDYFALVDARTQEALSRLDAIGSVSVESTTTGSPGTEASASVRKDGTGFKFSFMIPRGEKGEAGEGADVDLSGYAPLASPVFTGTPQIDHGAGGADIIDVMALQDIINSHANHDSSASVTLSPSNWKLSVEYLALPYTRSSSVWKKTVGGIYVFWGRLPMRAKTVTIPLGVLLNSNANRAAFLTPACEKAQSLHMYAELADTASETQLTITCDKETSELENTYYWIYFMVIGASKYW